MAQQRKTLNAVKMYLYAKAVVAMAIKTQMGDGNIFKNIHIFTKLHFNLG